MGVLVMYKMLFSCVLLSMRGEVATLVLPFAVVIAPPPPARLWIQGPFDAGSIDSDVFGIVRVIVAIRRAIIVGGLDACSR